MPQFLEHSMTAWRGQKIEHQHSLIDRFDPRARVITLVLFALATVFSHNLITPSLALILSLIVASLSNLNFKRTLRRVIAMDLFVVIMVFMLPFTMQGEAMFYVFGFPASFEGLYRAIEIGLKTNAVVLMLLALVGTLEASTLGHALARLKMPEKLVHLMLFTIRYLEVISREYRRMRKAMKARAFRPQSNWHTWRSVGYLVGMLLVHSLERSERTYAAMKCRGYSGKFYLLDQMQWQQRDYWLLTLGVVWVGLAIGVAL